ncbi:F-box/kelch-repeat protein-like protein [Salvia divinorum]|uniref:F-box/kelch-repeat protein-like protein n=1 Tax=Salvia divinorum TaxID=28513 RepID=A0ABD1IKS0_SALDI
MIDDVFPGILLHLPVQSLLRFRAVCKSWRCIIDSPAFRKLHIHTNNCNKSEDAIFLHARFYNNGVQVQHNGRSLILKETAHFKDVEWPEYDLEEGASFYEPVKGLICVNYLDYRVPMAICNPFLGQFKIIPALAESDSCSYMITRRSAAVGFDGDEDYKVVQLLECEIDSGIHAHIYSSKTGAWKELVGDGGMLDDMEFCRKHSPMKSACKNGYFAHWCVYGRREGRYGLERYSLILSFNMRNEEFEIIDCGADYATTQYFSEGEHSFLRFDFHLSFENFVQIYKSSFEGEKLSWNPVMHVEVTSLETPPQWSNGCALFVVYNDVFVYDYRARKFIGITPRRNIRESKSRLSNEKFFEHRGSFVSPM